VPSAVVSPIQLLLSRSASLPVVVRCPQKKPQPTEHGTGNPPGMTATAVHLLSETDTPATRKMVARGETVFKEVLGGLFENSRFF
jgi:hypothetical protein